METPTPPVDTVTYRRRRGRPSLYTPQLTALILTLILTLVRTHGLAPTAAAMHAGIGRATLSRWRYEYPNLDSRLHHARSEYRTAHRIGRPRSRTTADGRPNWRTAAYELEQAFPEEYSMDPKRRAAYRAARDAETAAFEHERARWLAEQQHASAATPPESSEIPPVCASAPLREPSSVAESSEIPLRSSTPVCDPSPAKVPKIPSAPSAAPRETSPSAPVMPEVPKFPSFASLREPSASAPVALKFQNPLLTTPSRPKPLEARIQPAYAPFTSRPVAPSPSFRASTP